MVNSTVNFLMHASFCKFPFLSLFFAHGMISPSHHASSLMIIHATNPLTHGEPYEYFFPSQSDAWMQSLRKMLCTHQALLRQHQVINIIHDIFSRRLHLQCDELSQAGGPARLADADASCGGECLPGSGRSLGHNYSSQMLVSGNHRISCDYTRFVGSLWMTELFTFYMIHWKEKPQTFSSKAEIQITRNLFHSDTLGCMLFVYQQQYILFSHGQKVVSLFRWINSFACFTD